MSAWHAITTFLIRDVAVWGDFKSPLLSLLGSAGLVMFFVWHARRLRLEASQAAEPIVRLQPLLAPLAEQVEAWDLRRAIERATSGQHGLTMADTRAASGESDLKRLAAVDREMRDAGALRRPWVQFRKTLLIERAPWFKDPRVFSTRRAEEFFTQDAVLGGQVDLAFYGQVPSLITGLGLLLTFVAICIGLSRLHADGQTVMGIQGLINGLAGKFLTSIVGLVCANAFVLVEKPTVRRLLNLHAEFVSLLDESFPRRTVEDLLDELRARGGGRESGRGESGVSDDAAQDIQKRLDALTAAVLSLSDLGQEPRGTRRSTLAAELATTALHATGRGARHHG